jgi:hypothetical protein
MNATREHQKLQNDLAQLPSIRARIRDLEAQVSAFDSPEAKARRERNTARFAEREILKDRYEASLNFLEELRRLGSIVQEEQPAPSVNSDSANQGHSSGFIELLNDLGNIEAQIRENLRSVMGPAGDRCGERSKSICS